MNDILLTPEEIEAEGWKALEKWEKHHEPNYNACREDDNGWRTYCDAWLCRAQVTKLIDWLEGGCTEHEPSIFAFTLPVERRDCPECWAALKAAGGE